jgi:hypothetical protein
MLKQERILYVDVFYYKKKFPFNIFVGNEFFHLVTKKRRNEKA